MAIPKNVFLGLIYKFPFTGITALRLCVLTSKNVRVYALIHQRNLFCLLRQKRFFLAFGAKNWQNTVKSGSEAVNRLLQSPIFHIRATKTAKTLVYFLRFFAL